MLRGGLAVVVVALCWSLKPFGLYGVAAVGAGLLLAAIILVIEMRLAMGYAARITGRRAWGSAGDFCGGAGDGGGVSHCGAGATKSFFESGVLVAFAYLGAVLGSQKARNARWKKEEEEALRRAARYASPRDGTRAAATLRGRGDPDTEAAGYERFDRWTDRRHLRGALSRWAAAGAGVCAA